MARKIIDVWPVLSVTPEQAGKCWTKDQALNAYREVNEALKRLQTPSRFTLNIGFDFKEDARCEHCNHPWTEESPVYNGGCCGKDVANDPERLVTLRAQAAELLGDDLYVLDEDHSATDDRPGVLAQQVLQWLETGRGAEMAAGLVKLADGVRKSDWCTIWSDPGDYPSNAGGSALPDRITPDGRPDDFARNLLDLLDDIGLLPRPAPAPHDEVVF